MEGEGESHVWDAVKFALDKVLGPKTLERRRAVVLMTDGVDGALARKARIAGSKISLRRSGRTGAADRCAYRADLSGHRKGFCAIQAAVIVRECASYA